jgi:predicted Zn-dependent protease
MDLMMDSAARKKQLEALLELTPDDPELRYALGMEHASAGDDAGAVEHFQKLIALSPHYPPGYHMAARALVRLHRIDEAKAILSRGIPAAQAIGNLHAAGEMQELLAGLE